jgi:hypothetical protein
LRKYENEREMRRGCAKVVSNIYFWTLRHLWISKNKVTYVLFCRPQCFGFCAVGPASVQQLWDTGLLVYSGEAQRPRVGWHFLSVCQEKDIFVCQAPHISCLTLHCNWETHSQFIYYY